MPDFVIQLRPEPGDVPVMIRVRRLLKVALRGYGLRCVSIGEAAPRPADGSAAAGDADVPSRASNALAAPPRPAPRSISSPAQQPQPPAKPAGQCP
ncbi:MAG TPA: hypothetical protein VF624_03795 [Tepidisphaeraceae bacterium]|jgi:hypothetical protein